MAVENKYRVLVGLSESDTSKDAVIEIFLSQAQKKVLKARYPFGGYTDSQKADALERYSDNVDDIYVYLYNKQGAEGQTAHNENGTNRTYGSALIPDSYTADIVPIVKVFSI